MTIREVIPWVLAALGGIAAAVMAIFARAKGKEANTERKGRIIAEVDADAAETELAVSRETEAARADTTESLAEINTEVNNGLDLGDPYADINASLDGRGRPK